MKSKFLYFLFCVAPVLTTYSCGGDDAGNVFNCVGETIITHIRHNTDTNNALMVNYEIEYNGDYNLTSVQWEFGDGSTGSGVTTTHTYTSSGTYDVKAKVTVNDGGGSCSFTKDKSINVN